MERLVKALQQVLLCICGWDRLDDMDGACGNFGDRGLEMVYTRGPWRIGCVMAGNP
jgi:hypothetical protein